MCASGRRDKGKERHWAPFGASLGIGQRDKHWAASTAKSRWSREPCRGSDARRRPGSQARARSCSAPTLTSPTRAHRRT